LAEYETLAHGDNEEAQVNRGGGGDVVGSQKKARAKGKGKEMDVGSDSDLSVSGDEEEGVRA
jgi:hypothetical protein